jgi:DNA-binding SARP family transcriptional activator
MPILSARLLGSLDLNITTAGSERLAAQKARELLCYLLLHHGRPIRRELLLGHLWPDADPSRCRKSLRQALWQLQTTLGEPTSTAILEVASQSLMIRDTADLWLDVAEFRLTAENLRGIPAHQLSPTEATLANQAVRLYHGDLLEDFVFEWCLIEREWFKSTFLMILDKLMSYCETNCHYDCGVEYGELILLHDRAREYTHRRLMRLHHLRGDRTSALHQYTRCSEALREELELSPAAATLRLREQIRRDDLPSADHGLPRTIRPESGALAGGDVNREHELSALHRHNDEEPPNAAGPARYRPLHDRRGCAPRTAAGGPLAAP